MPLSSKRLASLALLAGPAAVRAEFICPALSADFADGEQFFQIKHQVDDASTGLHHKDLFCLEKGSTRFATIQLDHFRIGVQSQQHPDCQSDPDRCGAVQAYRSGATYYSLSSLELKEVNGQALDRQHSTFTDESGEAQSCKADRGQGEEYWVSNIKMKTAFSQPAGVAIYTYMVKDDAALAALKGTAGDPLKEAGATVSTMSGCAVESIYSLPFPASGNQLTFKAGFSMWADGSGCDDCEQEATEKMKVRLIEVNGEKAFVAQVPRSLLERMTGMDYTAISENNVLLEMDAAPTVSSFAGGSFSDVSGVAADANPATVFMMGAGFTCVSAAETAVSVAGSLTLAFEARANGVLFVTVDKSSLTAGAADCVRVLWDPLVSPPGGSGPMKRAADEDEENFMLYVMIGGGALAGLLLIAAVVGGALWFAKKKKVEAPKAETGEAARIAVEVI